MKLTRRTVLGSAVVAGLAIASGPLSRPAAAQDTIKIGAPFNVTGRSLLGGCPRLNGAKVKVKEINDAGGVLGKKLELVIYDTKTDPTVIAATASQLINQDKVPVALGFTDSDSALALGPIFQTAGVAFVTPGATSPKLPDQIGSDMFLACFGDNVQAAAGAEFVLGKLGGKTVYLLRDNSTEYTTLLAKYFKEAYLHGGGQYRAGGRLQGRRQVIHRADHQAEGIVAEARRALRGCPAGRHRTRRQADASSRSHAAHRGRRRLRHASAAQRRRQGGQQRLFLDPRLYGRRQHTAIVTFYKAYKAAYNTPPENAFAALGYDTVGLVADAITRAGSVDPAKIRDALAAPRATRASPDRFPTPRGAGYPRRRSRSSGSRTTSCTWRRK
jgi:ABC-type branched-chain amino acid transport systems, periplasmic component